MYACVCGDPKGIPKEVKVKKQEILWWLVTDGEREYNMINLFKTNNTSQQDPCWTSFSVKYPISTKEKKRFDTFFLSFFFAMRLWLTRFISSVFLSRKNVKLKKEAGNLIAFVLFSSLNVCKEVCEGIASDFFLTLYFFPRVKFIIWPVAKQKKIFWYLIIKRTFELPCWWQWWW